MWGEQLKYGITSEPKIKRRYTQEFLGDKTMTPIAKGSRKAMARMERKLVEHVVGPLNKEPWSAYIKEMQNIKK